MKDLERADQLMTDLEMTKLCAQALGLRFNEWSHYTLPRNPSCIAVSREVCRWIDYDPLHCDADAMELVKRIKLDIYRWSTGWQASKASGMDYDDEAPHWDDLNRAIVVYVSERQSAISKDAAASTETSDSLSPREAHDK